MSIEVEWLMKCLRDLFFPASTPVSSIDDFAVYMGRALNGVISCDASPVNTRGLNCEIPPHGEKLVKLSIDGDVFDEGVPSKSINLNFFCSA